MNKKINQILTGAIVAIVMVACGNSTEEKSTAPAFTITAQIDTLDYKIACLGKYTAGAFAVLDSTTIDSGQF